MKHPIYKRRYAVSCDLRLGCRIGCAFCYYRFGPTAEFFHSKAKLKVLATPKQFALMLEESKLVQPGDVVIVSARSDLSMLEHKQDFRDLLRLYPFDRKPVKFLILQRGIYAERDWEEFGPYPVFFGTTITPEASTRGFNSVRDDAQLNGLRRLRAAGCPPERISLELGPILPDAVPTACEIIKQLAKEGLVTFLTYRGISIGHYGDYQKEIEELKARGFDMPNAAPYTYDNGVTTVPHEYYLIKNQLGEETEQAIACCAAEVGLRVYRNTGHTYAREWGIKIAASRNNRVREEMLQYAQWWSLAEFKTFLARHFGITAAVETVMPENGKARVFRLDRRGTEDIAHAIGAATRTAVLFSSFANQPSLEDLQWYKDEGWLVGLKLEGAHPKVGGVGQLKPL